MTRFNLAWLNRTQTQVEYCLVECYSRQSVYDILTSNDLQKINNFLSESRNKNKYHRQTESDRTTDRPPPTKNATENKNKIKLIINYAWLHKNNNANNGMTSWVKILEKNWLKETNVISCNFQQVCLGLINNTYKCCTNNIYLKLTIVLWSGSSMGNRPTLDVDALTFL